MVNVPETSILKDLKIGGILQLTAGEKKTTKTTSYGKTAPKTKVENITITDD